MISFVIQDWDDESYITNEGIVDKNYGPTNFVVCK